jgi:hypothetical protein
MLGTITVGRHAAKWGYRRFGLPGAVVAGVAGVVGYRALRKRVKTAFAGGDSLGGTSA